MYMKRVGCCSRRYVFAHQEYETLWAAVTEVAAGFAMGIVLAAGLCLDAPIARTLSCTIGALNVLPAVVLARDLLEPLPFLRGTYSAGAPPDGDLGIVGPAWLMLASPLPGLAFYATRLGRKWLVAFVRERREKQYRYAHLSS